jgi:hypothetical protein
VAATGAAFYDATTSSKWHNGTAATARMGRALKNPNGSTACAFFEQLPGCSGDDDVRELGDVLERVRWSGFGRSILPRAR